MERILTKRTLEEVKDHVREVQQKIDDDKVDGGEFKVRAQRKLKRTRQEFEVDEEDQDVVERIMPDRAAKRKNNVNPQPDQ